MRSDLRKSWDEHTVSVVMLTDSGCSLPGSLLWGTVLSHGKYYLFDFI